MHVHETLQKISSHMRPPPAAWERETCGQEGEIKKIVFAQGGKYGERREYHALQGVSRTWERETGVTDTEWESGMASDVMMEGPEGEDLYRKVQ